MIEKVILLVAFFTVLGITLASMAVLLLSRYRRNIYEDAKYVLRGIRPLHLVVTAEKIRTHLTAEAITAECKNGNPKAFPSVMKFCKHMGIEMMLTPEEIIGLMNLVLDYEEENMGKTQSVYPYILGEISENMIMDVMQQLTYNRNAELCQRILNLAKRAQAYQYYQADSWRRLLEDLRFSSIEINKVVPQRTESRV